MINLGKVQGPQTTVKSLGIIWFSEHKKMPKPVINKTDFIPTFTTKEAVQKLMVLYRYYIQHIPFMRIIWKVILEITKKNRNLGDRDSRGPFTYLKKHYWKSNTLMKTNKLECLFSWGFSTWSLWTKTPQDPKFCSIGFLTKKFLWSENRYQPI